MQYKCKVFFIDEALECFFQEMERLLLITWWKESFYGETET
ncbi:hypothetical protein C2W58_02564 [Bacillus pumilus]|uniref:Uncharacterized protein n=1 Tax=Bacillus pumilus TaxID=1408 RepID=A0AB34QZ16_BACPU|nr:hypothetical protein B4127_2610 [Bacillus pumilus]RAP14461.1 hypothetical protein C2W58_02564 [Bacillus pumilus]